MKHSIVVRIVVVMVNFVDAHPLNDLTAAKVYSQDQIAQDGMSCPLKKLYWAHKSL